MIELIGYAAAIIGSFAFLPQVIKTFQTRSAEDLSVGTISALCTGAGLWVIYGMGIRSVPIVLANSISFALNFALLVLKLRLG